jgi:hypothetical protein
MQKERSSLNLRYYLNVFLDVEATEEIHASSGFRAEILIQEYEAAARSTR